MQLRSIVLGGLIVAAICVTLGGLAVQRMASADVVPPHLAIDAHPTNGTRPCDPVDATRTNAPTSGTYTVAICLVGSPGSPDAFEATVIWYGGVASAPEVADVGDSLDDNPDFNDGLAPEGFGTNWSCTGFGFGFPKGDNPLTVGITDAHIACNERSFVAGTLTAEPGLLATLTMQATGVETETFAFSTDGSSSVNSPASANNLCGNDDPCDGASVTQGVVGEATSTPVRTATATATNTPAPPAAATVLVLQTNVCVAQLAANAPNPSDAGSLFFACIQPLSLSTSIVDVNDRRVPNIDLVAAASQANGVDDGFGNAICDENPEADDLEELVCSLDARDGALDGHMMLTPPDFEALDVDGNQFHELDGQLIVVAFLANDRIDTVFHASVGLFDGAGANTYSCANSAFDHDEITAGDQPDEDCDGDGVPGDGVAVAFLRASAITNPVVGPETRGPAVVSVDHDGLTTTDSITVVGEPQTVSIEQAETELETGPEGVVCDQGATSADFADALVSLHREYDVFKRPPSGAVAAPGMRAPSSRGPWRR